jgi:DNA-binding ferritin-like protein
MPDKLQKLQELMKLANNSLSVEEFLANFKIVIDYVKKIEKNLDKKVDDKCENAQNELENIIKQLKETDQEYQDTLKRIEDDNQSTLSNLKKWALERVGDLFVKSNISQEIKKKLNEVDRLMEPLIGYKPPSTTELVNEVAQIVEKSITQQLPKIPSIEDIENDLPKLGDKIRDALELLQDDERLDVSAIKGLEDLIKKVEKLCVF